MKLVLVAILSLSFFVGCSQKDITSYNKAKMKHQIDRAEKAHKDLNRELKQ